MRLDINENFLFKGREVQETETEESQDEEISQESNLIQKKIDRKKQQQEENNSLLGSVAKTTEARNSTPRRRSRVYIVGDYLYRKADECKNDDGHVLHLECSGFSGQCKGRVHIDANTLKVIKFRQMHSCTKDPDHKFQIQMENEMKNLAETTKDDLKNIYNKVCLKNPRIGKRIVYKEFYNSLLYRRRMVRKAEGVC